VSSLAQKEIFFTAPQHALYFRSSVKERKSHRSSTVLLLKETNVCCSLAWKESGLLHIANMTPHHNKEHNHSCRQSCLNPFPFVLCVYIYIYISFSFLLMSQRTCIIYIFLFFFYSSNGATWFKFKLCFFAISHKNVTIFSQ
jgi:hypothetical protein